MRAYRTLLQWLPLVVSASGCSSSPPVVVTPDLQERLEAVPVVKVIANRHAGTAIPMSDRQFLTCLHVLRGATEATFNGVYTSFQVVAAGDGSEFEDWAVVQTDLPVPLSSAPAPMATEIPPRLGKPVYLIGYGVPRQGSPVSLEAVRMAPKQIVPGRSTRPSLFWITAPRDAVYVATEPNDAMQGMSGGPGLVWDERLETLAVVGMYFQYRMGTQVLIPLSDRTPTTGEMAREAPLQWPPP